VKFLYNKQEFYHVGTENTEFFYTSLSWCSPCLHVFFLYGVLAWPD